MHLQIRQGAHASKFQQDWRAGRKGGVDAKVEISARPDDRAEAFTDVKAPGGAGAAAESAAPSTGGAAAKGAAPTNGAAAPAAKGAAPANGAATNGAAATNGKAAEAETPWTKDQELALIKALKTVAKDAADRYVWAPAHPSAAVVGRRVRSACSVMHGDHALSHELPRELAGPCPVLRAGHAVPGMRCGGRSLRGDARRRLGWGRRMGMSASFGPESAACNLCADVR